MTYPPDDNLDHMEDYDGSDDICKQCGLDLLECECPE